MTTISHEAHVLAERDLPCKRPAQNWCLDWNGEHIHFSDCPATHRPTVETQYQRFMDEIAERDESFDLRWKADMRAIERWRRATGREMVLPDHADLCVWLLEQSEKPIDMVLFCPACGVQHVDEPDERTVGWENPPHKSHLCHGCGHIWRPADVPTNGVKAIKTVGKADSAPINPVAQLAAQSLLLSEKEGEIAKLRKPAYAMTIAELQAKIGELQGALHFKVLGDPRECVTGGPTTDAALAAKESV